MYMWLGGAGLILGASAISGLTNNAPVDAVKYIAKALMPLFIIPVVLGAAKPRQNDRLIRTFVLSLSSTVIVSLAGSALGIGAGAIITAQGRVQAFMNNPNALARLMAVTLPLAFHVLARSKSGKRATYLVCVLVLITGILSTGSFSGAATTIGAMAVYLMTIGRMRRVGLAAGVLAVIGAGVAVLGPPSAFQRRISSWVYDPTVSSAGSLAERIELARTGVEIVASKPLTGVGPGMFQEVTGMQVDVHVAYLALASEIGILSILGFALCVLAVLSVVWKAKDAVRDRAAFATGLAVIVSFILGVSSSPDLFAREWWIPLVLAIGVAGHEGARMLQNMNRDRQAECHISSGK